MDSEALPVILAVDPGREKCGVAVVARSGEVLYRAIVPSSDLTTTVHTLIEKYHPIHLVCGRGTGSKPIVRGLQDTSLQIPLNLVDEAYTSEAARARYVAENPPRGLAKLLPHSLRTPPVPYDDYVAIILAERFWQEYTRIIHNE
jgi:RNase H-fold protein (predicted Holliday junction resolvase)